jgi:SAM-dependent methyltransferase
MILRITARQEQQFYDSEYARYRGVPDHALRTNRESILRDLRQPAGAFYERRKLHGAVLDQLLSKPLAGRVALDYGCGLGEWGVLMATEGACVTLLDLSPVAIEVGLRRAAANGVAERVRGVARDAADLSCFASGEFDLIYAGAALHHTLKYPNALAELVRVLRPGGKLILAETYGNNRLLNWLRRARWRLSGQPDEAGEEVILSDRELDLLRARFSRLEITPMNLLAMAKRMFRGHFESATVRRVLELLEAADERLLNFMPALKRHCGEVLVVAEK